MELCWLAEYQNRKIILHQSIHDSIIISLFDEVKTIKAEHSQRVRLTSVLKKKANLIDSDCSVHLS